MQEVSRALGVQHRGAVGADRVEPFQRHLGVEAHLVEPPAAQQRPQVGQRALHGVAVGEGAAEGCALGGRSPAFGVTRVTDERVDQRTVYRDGRMLLDPLVGRKPIHPPQHRVEPAARPDGVGHREHEPGHPIPVPGPLGVPDGRLRQTVRLVPGRRPGVELGDHLRLPPHQLGVEQLPEEVVVAVPLAPSVERDHQQVAALQTIEHAAGLPAAHGGVAEGTAEPVEDRAAGEERHVGPRDAVEELRTQVVGDEAVIPGGNRPSTRTRAARVHRQRRQVQPGRPSLGPLDELIDVDIAEFDLRAAEQRPGLIGVHRQIPGRDLDHPALRSQARHREGQLLLRADRQRRTTGQPHRQLGHDVSARTIRERLGLVEHHDDRRFPRRQRADQTADISDAPTPRPQRPQHRRIDALDPIQGHRQIRQQHRRIVVAVIQRDPGDAGPQAGGPLRQQRRLAVTGGRHDGHQRVPRRCVEPLDDGRTSDEARAGAGRLELGGVELEGKLRPRPTFSRRSLARTAWAQRRHWSERYCAASGSCSTAR